MLKKITKILGIIIATLFVGVMIIYFSATGPVINTPYHESGYYIKSCSEIDSLKKNFKPAKGKLLAGFSKISITPVLNAVSDNIEKGEFVKMPLAGFGARKGAPATGIHDTIFVKVAALKVENKLVLLVGADLLIMPPNIGDSVIAGLSGYGITRNQVFFSATHTHSSLGAWGVGFAGKEFAGEENKNLEKWLIRQVSKAILDAIADLKPASIATGDFNAAAFTRNRLIGEKGTKNDDFSYLYIQQTEGRKAVIGSFSAHSTCLGDKNMEISGDYPGYWQRKMENNGYDVALFMAGAVGSQTNRGEGSGFEKPRFIGESLADSTIKYLNHCTLNDSALLASATIKLNLPEYHYRLTTNRNLATSLTEKLMPLAVDPVLQAFRIGNMVWITTPADFSGEFALQFKHSMIAQGFLSNISSFNGNYVGYIIPGRYFYIDGYEPKDMGFFGPTMGDYTFDLINQLANLVIN